MYFIFYINDMAKTIYGILENAAKANSAIDDLFNAGFTKDDLSAISRDNVEIDQRVEETTKTDNVGSSAATGALTGGAVGALAGLLVGISAITLPPLGGIFIAGPLASALGISTAAASTIAGGGIGALGGGLVGALVGLGIPEEAAVVYEERLTNNGVLIGISCDSDEEGERAKDILTRNGASNLVTV